MLLNLWVVFISTSMLHTSLGISPQLAASLLLRVMWKRESAGGLNGRRLKRVEWLRSAGAACRGTPEQVIGPERREPLFHGALLNLRLGGFAPPGQFER
jgi:hypothetical protein